MGRRSLRRRTVLKKLVIQEEEEEEERKVVVDEVQNRNRSPSPTPPTATSATRTKGWQALADWTKRSQHSRFTPTALRLLARGSLYLNGTRLPKDVGVCWDGVRHCLTIAVMPHESLLHDSASIKALQSPDSEFVPVLDHPLLPDADDIQPSEGGPVLPGGLIRIERQDLTAVDFQLIGFSEATRKHAARGRLVLETHPKHLSVAPLPPAVSGEPGVDPSATDSLLALLPFLHSTRLLCVSSFAVDSGPLTGIADQLFDVESPTYLPQWAVLLATSSRYGPWLAPVHSPGLRRFTRSLWKLFVILSTLWAVYQLYASVPFIHRTVNNLHRMLLLPVLASLPAFMERFNTLWFSTLQPVYVLLRRFASPSLLMLLARLANWVSRIVTVVMAAATHVPGYQRLGKVAHFVVRHGDPSRLYFKVRGTVRRTRMAVSVLCPCCAARKEPRHKRHHSRPGVHIDDDDI